MKTRAVVQWFLGAVAIVTVAGALGADEPGVAPVPKPKAMTAMPPGQMAKQFAARPGVIFAHALADAPGKNLVVVALKFPPKSASGRTASPACVGHHHPGSVYVYITQGTARLGLAGQPVHVVHTGESFFEPVGALHTVGESASATEPASAIAVMVVPDGAPLATPVCGHR
jgi:quercetin dioxygenase-like cupin family protein